MKRPTPLLACWLLLPAAVLALDNGVGRTPLMGWMAWIRFRCNINCADDPNNCVSEQLFMDMADRMVADGWLDAGYDYVSVDDCWQSSARNASDNAMVANATRFPSGMKALGDYIHAKGLKFGLYTAMGDESCQGYPAFGCRTVDDCAQAHLDVQQFVDWGVDYIKVDSCRGANASAFNTTHPLISSWFLEAGRAAGRPVLYHPSGFALSTAHLGTPTQYRLMARTANMWRHFADMQPVWTEVEKIVEFWAAEDAAAHPTTYANEWQDFLAVSRPGVFQDPDALLVGNINGTASCRKCLARQPRSGFCPDQARPNEPCICCGTLTSVEEQTNMAFWSLWAAPLEIAADLRNIPAAAKAILQNREVIAVNQDPLVDQGRRVSRTPDGVQVWTKRLAGGSVAVLVFNANATAKVGATFAFETVGFTSADRVRVRDVIRGVDLGEHVGGLALAEPVPGHGVAMFNATVVWDEEPSRREL